jgi:hypothetical protein
MLRSFGRHPHGRGFGPAVINFGAVPRRRDGCTGSGKTGPYSPPSPRPRHRLLPIALFQTVNLFLRGTGFVSARNRSEAFFQEAE